MSPPSLTEDIGFVFVTVRYGIFDREGVWSSRLLQRDESRDRVVAYLRRMWTLGSLKTVEGFELETNDRGIEVCDRSREFVIGHNRSNPECRFACLAF